MEGVKERREREGERERGREGERGNGELKQNTKERRSLAAVAVQWPSGVVTRDNSGAQETYTHTDRHHEPN